MKLNKFIVSHVYISRVVLYYNNNGKWTHIPHTLVSPFLPIYLIRTSGKTDTTVAICPLFYFLHF